MKLFKSIALLAAMTLMFAVSAAAAPSGNLVAKVKSFDFLVDDSGSMMMKNNSVGMISKTTTKIEIAKQALSRVNDKVPSLNYNASLHTLSNAATVLAQGPYDRAAMAKGINSIKTGYSTYGRYTTLGDTISALASDYNRMSRKAAVIVATDGANNLGSDPVAEATAIYNANPDICFHFISLADTQYGKDTIKTIANMRKCSVVAEAADLAKSDAAVDQFVRDVFYDQIRGGVIALRSVQFALDSAAITDASAVILDEVADMLKANPRNVEVTGHTCTLGSAEYNMALSQRRANAVKDYLVRKGVPAASMGAVGKGLTEPKYDNRTDEGRRLNRRAEIN